MSNQPGALSAAEQAYATWRHGRLVTDAERSAWYAGYDAGSGPGAELYGAVADFIATGEERAYATVMLAFRNYPDPADNPQ